MQNVRFSLILFVALACALLASNLPTQENRSAEVLLGAALHQEEVEGNLEQAIESYKKFLSEYPDNRPLAAKALFQMGRCYEKLGNAEARKAYERLIRDYADQSEQAKLARARLAALRQPAGLPTFTTRQVWVLPDMGNIEGAPSPDGRYLSFVDWETGDLAIRDLESGTSRRLTDKGPWEKSDEFALFSRWSADGKRIAYDWYDSKGCMGLRVISTSGGKPRALVDYGEDGWVQTYDWSPGGKQILAFVQKENGTCQIALVSATDGTARAIRTFEKDSRFPQVMCFSRDGRYVVYDRPQQENATEHDIFAIPVDGGKEVALVRHPAHDLLLGWPPDGKGIIFASDRSGSMGIWYLPVSGGKAQGSPDLIKTGVERIYPLGFTRNGSFYYVQGRWMLDVYVAGMDRQGGKILAPPEKAIRLFEGANSWPEYSPDGKYLAYVSTRSHRFQAAVSPNVLCIHSLQKEEKREFPTKFRNLAGLRWSRDSQSIYLAAWDYQGMGIYRADTHTGTMVPIVRDEGRQRIFAHSLSRDGKTLIYVRCEAPKEPYRILRRNLATDEEEQIYAADHDQGRLSIALSPDGQWLAVINLDKKKCLRLIPASGGEVRDLLRYEEARSLFAWIEWTTDGKYILFPRWQPRKDSPLISLWRAPANGGGPEELGLVMANFQNLSVHPDGQHLAFSSMGFTRKSPVVWVMENFLE